MRKVIITVGLGLVLLLPATAFAAPATPHKSVKPTHARSVKHAKLKTPAKHTKRAGNDRALMTPKWT